MTRVSQVLVSGQLPRGVGRGARVAGGVEIGLTPAAALAVGNASNSRKIKLAHVVDIKRRTMRRRC
eukprot:2423310-Amphidinium_carterae.1